MNRRSLVALPAGIAALAAGRALAQTQDTASIAVSHASTKALVKQSGSKAAYKVPKNAAKQTRYLNSLTALLSLTSAQQSTVGAIITNAASNQATVHGNLKAARKALKDAVKGNDSGAITQASSTLGVLTGQHITIGATANASIYQLLTPAQQTLLSKFQG